MLECVPGVVSVARPIFAPLLQRLNYVISRNYLRCHTPGHKGAANNLFHPEWVRMIGAGTLQLDLSEVAFTDNLYRPQRAIRAAQLRAARCFGAGQTCLLVNGATVGLQSALWGSCQPGDIVLAPRNCHQAVWAGLVLSGATPVYLQPVLDLKWGSGLGLNPANVIRAINQYPQARVLVLTNPTYYGTVAPLAEIITAAHSRGLRVLVDEAHGAHFHFHHQLPAAALDLNADLVVHGAHKVLTALTQAAFLHWGKGVEAPVVRQALQLLQTTSPSYLLLASLDAARMQVERDGTMRLERIIKTATAIRQDLNQIRGIECLGDEVIGQPGISGYDPTRLVVNALDLGLNGYQLAQLLRRNYRIQVEMADPVGVILLLTMVDLPECRNAIVAAFKDLAAKRQGVRSPITSRQCWCWQHLPQVELTPRQAMDAGRRTVAWNEAVGVIAGELVVPYPPGIPLLCPGEMITAEIWEIIDGIKRMGGQLLGPLDQRLASISIIDR